MTCNRNCTGGSDTVLPKARLMPIGAAGHCDQSSRHVALRDTLIPLPTNEGLRPTHVFRKRFQFHSTLRNAIYFVRIRGVLFHCAFDKPVAFLAWLLAGLLNNRAIE